jgi:glycerophosphoryl diester phosphodiesterase
MSYSPRPLPAGFLARAIAHRGLHGADGVENTGPAFEAAIRGGYGIECDVTPSFEHEAIVFHDDTLDRLTTATGPVAAHSAAELLAIPFKRGAAGMMTLEALFKQVAGRTPLVVEVKSLFDGQTPLVARIASLAAGYAGPLVFKSFDPAQIIALRAAGLRQPLGIVAMETLDDAGVDARMARSLGTLAHLEQSRPDFLSWRAAELPHAVPANVRQTLALPLMAWTVRDEASAKRIAPYVDQIVFEGFRPILQA